MIKKLQRKMVIIMMVAICVVLSAIMISINVINYTRITKDADELISILATNSGRFPKPMGGGKDKHFNINKETPYETRFFTVKLNHEGKIEFVDTGNVAAIDSKEAVEYANQVIENDKDKGYVDYYRYNYIKEKNMLIFVDCNRQLGTASAFLKASVLISVIGILTVFGLVIVFSNRVVEPMRIAYDKQRRFVSDSSHEIKTPLAVILANTEVLEMLNGESEWTMSIRNQVERLDELNTSLTKLSKLEEINVKLEKKKVNLSQLISEAIMPFQAILIQNEKELHVDVEEDISYICDESGIKQLVNIYMDNAVKYSKSYVNVSLKKNNGKCILLVENDTNGIEKGNLDKVFERFYRLDESRNNEIKGFGIGLSIAKSIADSHGAKINASSEDGIIFKMTTTF